MRRSGSGIVRRIEPGGDRVLVDVTRVDPFVDEPARGLDDLGPPAVVERDPELEPFVVRRLLLEPVHRSLQLGRRAVAAADEARRDSLPARSGSSRSIVLDEDLHERVDLVGRPRPVLGREREDADRLDAEVDSRLDGPAERLCPCPVAGGDRESPPAGPAAVPVHDDRDRMGDVGQLGLRRRCPGRQRAQTSEEAQTSMISASLRFRRSSIFATCSSVSFWTRSSARRSSSSPTSPS